MGAEEGEAGMQDGGVSGRGVGVGGTGRERGRGEGEAGEARGKGRVKLQHSSVERAKYGHTNIR